MVRIPTEYQEVEYLESTGTQYIKTNIESRFSIEYESDIMFTAAQDSYSVGCIDSNHRICGNGFYRSYFQIGYGNNYRDVNVGGLNENTLYRLKTVLTPGEQKVYVNGVLKGTESIPKPSVILTEKHIAIFGRLKDDNEFGQECKARLYSLTVSDGDLILGNFIPCYRKSDNEPGMYDTVTKQFFTNAGTGTFIVGNDVSWEAIDLLALRRMVMLSMASGVWKQKRVAVQNAIALGDGFAEFIANNIPSGVTFALIVKDNLDPNTFINNQLIYGAYDTANPGNNMLSRYRNDSYNQVAATTAWSNTYALTASAGDLYSIFYQA